MPLVRFTDDDDDDDDCYVDESTRLGFIFIELPQINDWSEMVVILRPDLSILTWWNFQETVYLEDKKNVYRSANATLNCFVFCLTFGSFQFQLIYWRFYSQYFEIKCRVECFFFFGFFISRSSSLSSDDLRPKTLCVSDTLINVHATYDGYIIHIEPNQGINFNWTDEINQSSHKLTWPSCTHRDWILMLNWNLSRMYCIKTIYIEESRQEDRD